jgi:hypothetical protein
MVALHRDAAIAHVVKNHIDHAFDIEEVPGDPPAGAFVCVARCGLSGELLGPPNHSSYSERLRETRLAFYPEMTLSEYEKHVETLHDTELIEKWREASRTQRIYKPRKGSARGRPMKAVDALVLFQRDIAPSLVSKTSGASIPSRVARRTEDPMLMRALTDAWQRENRYPHSLLFALRGAFRHKGLFLFKAGKGLVFVGSTQPSPLDTEHTIESIREVLIFMRKHPGCTREELLEALRPGVAEDAEDAIEVLSPLTWLTEKGHVIEFFNGTLAVPLSGGRKAKT